jgi:glycyl-tRNA synthetase beta chain
VERIAFVLQSRGLGADVADAALAVRALQPLDVEARARTLTRLRAQPELGMLVTIHKRLRNILAQAEPGEYDPAAMTEPAERELAQAFDQRADALEQSLDQADYEPALRSLAELAEPLHRFFDDVMVMVDDPRLRANRTGLLARIRDALERFADFGRLNPSAD